MAVIFDKATILERLVTWINDVTQSTIQHRFVYAGDDIGTNLGEPSKSYMQGQFYYNSDINTVYVSLVLDPNSNWGYDYDAKELFIKIMEHIQYQVKRSLLEDLHIEFVLPKATSIETHEAKSLCRTEEINDYITEDIMYLWEDIHNNKMFIRDNTLHINNRTKLIYDIGVLEARDEFFYYRAEIGNLNQEYSGRVLENIDTIFSRYITLYNNHFTSYDHNIKLPKIIQSSDIQKFYLLNFTDYSIKE